MSMRIWLTAIGCAAAWVVAPVAAPGVGSRQPGGAALAQSATDQIQRQMERGQLQLEQRRLNDAQARTRLDLQLNRSLPSPDPRSAVQERVLEGRLRQLEMDQRTLTDRLWRLEQPPATPPPRPAPFLPRQDDPDGGNRPVLRPGQGSTAMAGSDASSEQARRYVEDLLRSYEARQQSR